MEKLDSLGHDIRNRIDHKIGHLVLIDRSKCLNSDLYYRFKYSFFEN